MAPSVVGSLNEKDEKNKKAKLPIVIWPEWTEQDIGQEKWDTSHKAKEKEKGKSPNLVRNFILQTLTLQFVLNIIMYRILQHLTAEKFLYFTYK